MNVIILSIVSVLSLMVFSGCGGDTPDKTESNNSIEELPLSSMKSLERRISLNDASAIKPLQIITNKQDLSVLYEMLQLEHELDEEFDFTKDLVVVVKRFSNAGYGARFDLSNDGNKTIEIKSRSAEISMGEEDVNASISVGFIKNAFDKPIYLTKSTTLIDQETAKLRKMVASYATATSEGFENLAYLASGSNLNYVAPLLVASIDSSDSSEAYALAYDFNLSQLRFNNELFDEGRIISSGYYVSPDNEASYDTPELDIIHNGEEMFIAVEDNTSEWVSAHHYIFEINGVRQDCNETYPNKKEALFYKIDRLRAQEVIYHTAQQNIRLKSCSNIRTTDLDALGAWISERTWQGE